MSGQLYNRVLYPRCIRPCFRIARERFKGHKRLRRVAAQRPGAILLEDSCRAHSQANDWREANAAMFAEDQLGWLRFLCYSKQETCL